MDNKVLMNVATHFQFEGKVKTVRSLGEGLINDTFFVETTGHSPNYILQRKNKNIFQNIPAMMNNIYKVTTHLKNKIIETGGDPFHEALTLIQAEDGKFYYKQDDDYWTACLFIEDTITHQLASSLELAYQGGKGIGKFQSMLSDMKESLDDILPGFHNIKFRFDQWDRAIENDKAGRIKQLPTEISWIEKYRKEMLDFYSKIEAGIIPSRVTHNDTKISNILFDKSGNILCVIDLDTVMNTPCLYDYGDAIRSYANAGLEDDRNTTNVFLKMDTFENYTKGYLSEASSFLSQEEINNLAFSAKYITFEQVLRFLMDYINGDSYYRINYDKHNLVRTYAQYRLLESIEENYAQMCETINKLLAAKQ
jgi:thiamine kinase-like enzyme